MKPKLRSFSARVDRLFVALACCVCGVSQAAPVLITPGNSAGYLYYSAAGASAASTSSLCSDAKAAVTRFPGENCKTDTELVKFVAVTGGVTPKALVATRSDNGLKSRADASSACTSLGAGWSLPGKNQLRLLFVAKKEIGGFSGDVYWSGAAAVSQQAPALYFVGPKKGQFLLAGVSELGAFRCVKELPLS